MITLHLRYMIKRKGVILSDVKMLINGMGRFELLGKHLSGINTRKRTGLFIITCPKLSILLTMTFMNYRGCHFQCYHSLNHCCSFQLLKQQCQCAEGMQIIVLNLCIVTVSWKILEILAPLSLIFIANHEGIIDT